MSQTPLTITVPTPEEVEALLLKSQYKELDNILNALQQAFERRELNEEDLRQSFILFDGYRPKHTVHLQRWIDLFPNSYAAKLSIGSHLAAQAWWYRTYRRATEVPRKNWSLVAKACEGSAGHLNDALELTSEPALAAALRMQLNTLWAEDTWDGYVDAVRRCPTSLAVRLAKISALRPEWGGSVQGMYAFLQRPEHETLSAADQKALRADVLICEGHHLHMFQDNPAAAMEKFEEALDLHVSSSALIAMGNALRATAPDRAEAAYRQALALEPYKRDGTADLGIFLITERQQFREGLNLIRKAQKEGSPLANDFINSMPRGPLILIRILALFNYSA